MEDMNKQPVTVTPFPPATPKPQAFPTGSREWIFAAAALIGGLLLCNFTLFGGYELGFAIGIDLCILISVGYLLSRGHRLSPYSALLLGLSLVIGAGFARSDDGFVKFIMACFLFVSINLGLTLLAGQQRHDPAGIQSLKDCFYTAFVHSLGRTGTAFSGLKQTLPKKDQGAGKVLSVLQGLVIALPVVVIMVFLLVQADAAFEGLMDLLPDFDLDELPGTLFFGVCAFCLIYCQGVSLQHREKQQPAAKAHHGMSPLTVNTVLIAVCLVYLVYLLSQLAYFTGGFAGILPQGYTMSEYARRGFFEMAVLCGINLAIIGLSVGLVAKKPAAPLLTRLLCLFITAITVFFVVSSSGKMFMYMDTYGLTRLRVLTQVIMLWLGLSTVLVAVWLMVPKLPYMKTIIAAGLIIGAVVLWADVDNLVAGYNVDRYLSGAAQEIDVDYLKTLNRSAVPHVARLAQEAPDESVRLKANSLLHSTSRLPLKWQLDSQEDFRGWNYAKEASRPFIKK